MRLDGDLGIRCLRQPPEGPPQEVASKPGPTALGEKAPREEAFIHCRSCLHPITRPADRIEIEGLHRHTFANPHGIVFEIGSFGNAPGCGVIGPASEEFTWFAGHAWRVCLCAACGIHLGWQFTPAAGSPFFGLILDRLIEPT